MQPPPFVCCGVVFWKRRLKKNNKHNTQHTARCLNYTMGSKPSTVVAGPVPEKMDGKTVVLTGGTGGSFYFCCC